MSTMHVVSLGNAVNLLYSSETPCLVLIILQLAVFVLTRRLNTCGLCDFLLCMTASASLGHVMRNVRYKDFSGQWLHWL